MFILPLLTLVAACGADAAVYKVPLDASGSTTLSWRVDYDVQSVQVEVHTPAMANTWFALGFSDYGDLVNADYCVLWVDWKGTTQIQDVWAGPDGRLQVDAQQDCANLRMVRRRDVTKFSFTRRFDTCDSQDYVLQEGTTHVVWARGRGPLYRLGGLDITGAAETGMQRTQLLKNVNPPAKHPPDTWQHAVLTDSVAVPSGDTTYWCHVQKLPEALQDKHHVVQFESAIQAGNEALVHHMELFHCEAAADVEMPEYKGSCFAKERPEVTQVCKRVLSAWAMGAPPFVYPQEAGLPIGGPDFNPYVMLEVHYNNPELKSDWVDTSGIRLYLSPSLRQFDGGVIELGLEYSDKMAIPPQQSEFVLTGYCITECTAVGIPAEGIVIFGSQLHTHLTGIRVKTRHVRDGQELPELNKDDHYSTHFQEIRMLKKPVQILPGDALITSCVYRTTDRENITLGGFAISDEMCVNYVHYYPKVELEVCKSSVSSQSLNTYFQFLSEWEGQGTSPDLGISDNYRAVDWSPMRASVLHELYQESPLSMQCNQSTGDRFPGYWDNMPVSAVLYPLPPPVRSCTNVV